MAGRDAFRRLHDGVVQVGGRVVTQRSEQLADDGALARCLGAVDDDVAAWRDPGVDESREGVDLGVAAGEGRRQRGEEVVGQVENGGGHAGRLRHVSCVGYDVAGIASCQGR